MAGHSKWANIQHRKGRVDAARGKLWSRLSKGIIVAAQSGGGDPASNFKLRRAIEDAKAASMPKDNIERAIKRGTGELEGGRVEELVYEGYGPGGVAILCESLTDNRNRTAPEIRSLFSKLGGELGKTGCVSYLFDRKGLFVFDGEQSDEDQITEIALEHGGEDVETTDEGKLQVTSSPDDFDTLADAFQEAGVTPEVKQVTLIPQTIVEVDAETGRKAMRLLEQLDDHDDVQNVSTNLNVTDEMLQEQD
jgi:YebC/PmpR family DNA-binding regulatory protein